MGRPKKKRDEAKSKFIRVRVTNAERAKIARKWKASEAKTISDWIRQRLLGDE